MKRGMKRPLWSLASCWRLCCGAMLSARWSRHFNAASQAGRGICGIRSVPRLRAAFRVKLFEAVSSSHFSVSSLPAWSEYFLQYFSTAGTFDSGDSIRRWCWFRSRLPPLMGVKAFYLLYGKAGTFPQLLGQIFHVSPASFALTGIAGVLAGTHADHVSVLLFECGRIPGTDRRLFGRSCRQSRRFFVSDLDPRAAADADSAHRRRRVLTFMSSMASYTAPLLVRSEQRHDGADCEQRCKSAAAGFCRIGDAGGDFDDLPDCHCELTNNAASIGLYPREAPGSGRR